MIVEKLTKLDVARRQIDEAIRMFFERRDSVSTHTIASAAAQVLADIGKTRGFQGWTRNKAIVKPDRWQEWRAAITRFERFFKHADRDADQTCDFHPEVIPFCLVESVEMLRVFTGKFTWAGLIFSVWFSLTYPEVLQESKFKELLKSQASLLTFDMNDFAVLAEFLKMRNVVSGSPIDGLLM